MGRAKKGSQTLERADQRLPKIKSINSRLDLGSGFSVMAYESEVVKTRKLMEAYNTELSKVDVAANAEPQAANQVTEMVNASPEMATA
ncbi:MAG: hypothetical protein ACFB0D_07290 [Phormidesmis sp.]